MELPLTYKKLLLSLYHGGAYLNQKNPLVPKKSLIFIVLGTGLALLLWLAFQIKRKTTSRPDLWVAPSWTDTLKNPYLSYREDTKAWGSRTSTAQNEGKKIYHSLCATCHGTQGRGDGAPGITFTIKPADFHDKRIREEKDGSLFWKISEGKGEMPAFKESLTDKQRWQLVAFIKNLSASNDSVRTITNYRNTLPAADYKIVPGMSSAYFPIPVKPLNVVYSERQLFTVDTLLTGLDMPWSIVFLPDSTVIIAERAGKLLRIKNGKLADKPVQGDIPEELRDIKLHPQFEKNGLIYLSYYINPTKTEGGYSVLMRARLEDERLSENKILYKAGPFKEDGFWYGSKITFAQKGHLFFTVGIRGARKNAMDLSNPAGKTMRFTPDGKIPSDNPFIHKPGALPEIYSYGHRVHEGLVYDKYTDAVWSTEFGELGGDEINIIRAGANYGWPEVTFSREYNGKPISKDSVRADVEPPVHHMSIAPSDLCFVYGDRYPGWNGNIFIGALRKTGPFLYRAEIKNKVFVHEEELLENIGRIRDVKYAPDHFLYLITEDSDILVRLVPVQKNRTIDGAHKKTAPNK